MDLQIRAAHPRDVEAQALAVGLWSDPDGLSQAASALDDVLRGELSRALEARRASGELGKAEIVALLPDFVSSPVRARAIIAVGLGPRRRFDPQAVRIAAAAATRKAAELRLTELAFCLALDGESEEVLPAVQAFAAVEGAVLADYRYETYKSRQDEPRTRLDRLICVISDAVRVDADILQAAMQGGLEVAEVTNLVRDLVNGPPDLVTPAYLAKTAELLAREEGLEYRCLWKDDLERQGMGGILAVNRGSARQPCLVRLVYRAPRSDARTLAVVGKGITFDSGGLSLKPAESMVSMHQDMAGAAGVIGFLKLAARTNLPCHVIGIFGATENLPSGTAYKPSDILRMFNGKTVEVTNTDAEGRLVLADALAYALQDQPDALVDLATLTGANYVTFGNHAAAAIGNDERLAELMRRAGAQAGERTWPLPLWREYRRQMESGVADLRNSGGRAAGGISAAAFLSEFVGDTPWVHLDIYGVAFVDPNQKTVLPYDQRGTATGFGPRLLREFVQLWAE